MPRYILKLDDKYCEWSTVVDAPVTAFMTIGQFKTYYVEEYGSRSLDSLVDRLRRVESHGTSAQFGLSADNLISDNRAGDDESTLSRSELLEQYTPED